MKNRNRQLMILNAEEKKSIVSFWPEMYDIEVTSYCNFKCRMCPHALLGNRIAKHLNPEVIERMKKYLKYAKKVALQGDGEPFLNPDIKEIICALHEAGVRLNTTTNLSVMDRELAELINKTFDIVTVSCDACEKELYEEIRRNGQFEVFCKHLDLLTEIADKPMLIMNCVMMRQNIHLAEKMVVFAKEHHIDRLVFSALLTDKDLGNQEDSLENYPCLTDKYLVLAKKKAKELDLDLLIPWDYHAHTSYTELQIEEELKRREQVKEIPAYGEEKERQFIARYRELKEEKTLTACENGYYECEGVCHNLYGKSYIDIEGNVMLCCFGKINCVGNVMKQDFADIWNGPSYVAARKAFFANKLPYFCIGCKYAISSQQTAIQPYPFKIVNIDRRFLQDDVFWENRLGGSTDEEGNS